MQMGEKAHLRTMAAVLANATATTLVYPSVQGPARARRPREPAGRRRPAGRRPPGPAPACGPHCSSSICFTGTVLTTCLPRVCFIATAVRRSHSSCYYYYYYYYIAPLRELLPQKRSGMARVIKESHSFTCTPTRSSASGMSHTCVCKSVA